MCRSSRDAWAFRGDSVGGLSGPTYLALAIAEVGAARAYARRVKMRSTTLSTDESVLKTPRCQPMAHMPQA